MPIGVASPVCGPEIVASGGVLPVAPAGKIATVFAAASVTYRRPVESSAIPPGVTSPVFGPDTTRLGVTLPVAPGANCSRASLLALATHSSPAESKVSPPIPLSAVIAPDSLAMGAALPVERSEKAFTSLLRPLPTHTDACGAANTCSEKTRVAGVGVGWAASSAVTVKVDVPAVVGVPLITPAGDSVSPAGRAPPLTDHVYGAVPEIAARVAEYRTPTAPAVSDAVCTRSGVHTQVSPRFAE